VIEDGSLRVLLVGLNARYGGTERHLLDLWGELRKRGHHVAIAVPMASEVAAHGREIDPHRVFEVPRGPAAIASLIRLLYGFQPQIVHLHSTRASILGRVSARLIPRTRRAGMVFLTSAHGWIPRRLRLYRWIEHAYNRTASWEDAAIAVARSVAEKLEANRYPNPILVVPNGLDRRWGNDLEGREFADGDTLHIGYFGRLSKEKGLATLIEALRSLQGRSWHLHVYGDGHTRAHVERAIAAAGVVEVVTLHGSIAPAAVPEHMGACHVIAIPSLQEGHPYVALEASRLGIPIIACRVGGLSDVVHEGRNGFLVTPGDPPALARALGRLLAEPRLLRQLRRDAITHRNDYTADDMTELVLEAYRRALSKRRPHPRPTAALGTRGRAR